MQEVREIYPGRIGEYETEQTRLAGSVLSNANKQLIAQFLNFRFAAGTKKVRVTKLSRLLRKIVEKWLKKDFDKVNKKDIEQLLADINLCEHYKQNTKADYRRMIRQLYLSWYKDEDKRLKSETKEIREEAEELYLYIERHVKRNDQLPEIDFRNILSEEDIDVIVKDGCKTLKEKAFIRTLHQTGARVGEFLNIQIRDVEIRPNFARIRLDGKTGERRVTVVKYAHLAQWLDMHPLKYDTNAFLWVGDSERYGAKPLFHRGGQKLIHRCFERAGYIKFL